MGCFVHVILLGVGCFVSLQKNMWWFSSTYNKMDVGCFVRGVFCPQVYSLYIDIDPKIVKLSSLKLTFLVNICILEVYSFLNLHQQC